MSLLTIFGLAFLITVGYVTIVWMISLWIQDASIMDVGWGLGFILLAWFYFFLTDGFMERGALVCGLVTVWGLRLSLHILGRNWSRGEDWRYRTWREQAGSRFWWISFFRVFFLQGFLLWLISAPLLAAQFSRLPAQLTALDWLGTSIWMAGFLFEAIGDWQLTNFRKNPANAGRVLRNGLWGYSRHPNYFGDATLWWGYFLIALATPGGLWTIFSPALMTWLLVRVSGVAMLERSLLKNKPDYQAYVRSTSAFVPWFYKGKQQDVR
jgi:steroid 5-alpha reductase family enzyme